MKRYDIVELVYFYDFDDIDEIGTPNFYYQTSSNLKKTFLVRKFGDRLKLAISMYVKGEYKGSEKV